MFLLFQDLEYSHGPLLRCFRILSVNFQDCIDDGTHRVHLHNHGWRES